ncbi:type I-E CRISPR-associated protein Cse2/CasB [Streptomyces sp. NPDC057020]|uniref:type I-E CRISPR-associated protein Cse2/CasB n=1 Tax=Streptomyces sp. NPDC057020 TaxID=3346002 RepID=UPI00363C6CF6
MRPDATPPHPPHRRTRSTPRPLHHRKPHRPPPRPRNPLHPPPPRTAHRNTPPPRGPAHPPPRPPPTTGPTAPQAAPDGQDRPTPAVGTEGQDHPNQTGPESTATPISPEHAAARQWRTRPNLGTSLALAVHRHGFDAPRMTDRLRLLTRLSTSQLHPRLWSLTTHLNARDAARLDFAVLLEDLTWWDDDRPQITTRWRESYFLTLHAHTPDEDH